MHALKKSQDFFFLIAADYEIKKYIFFNHSKIDTYRKVLAAHNLSLFL
jgi:hypothetical protein